MKTSLFSLICNNHQLLTMRAAAALVTAFSASMKTANTEVQQFRQLVMSDDSKQIFEHAEQRRAENSKNIKAWKITEHPNWLERDQ